MFTPGGGEAGGVGGDGEIGGGNELAAGGGGDAVDLGDDRLRQSDDARCIRREQRAKTAS